jgi:Flp pilus assembly protein TadD
MATLKCVGLFSVFAASMLVGEPTTGYVGSRACYACHSGIYRSFEKTGMGRSMSLASEWGTDKLAGQAVITQQGSTRTFAVSHNQSGWLQRESEPGVFEVEHPLDYVVGSGENGLTFLIRRGRFLFQAPLSYYSKSGKWDFSPGYEHVDLGFSREVPEECINCHAGRAVPVRNGFGAYDDPPFQQLAIGCENCHGPGEAHVKSLGKLTGSIVNPAKLKPRLAEDICLNCHQSGDARVTQPGKSYLDFRPGEWLFDTAIIFKQPAQPGAQEEADLLNHVSAMRSSRCFRESAGKLSCLTCHDPHTQPRESAIPTYYRAKCLTCHSEQSCRLSTQIRAAQNPPDDCVGCHMPKRKVTQISHSALTNHRIPARESELVSPMSQPEVDGLLIVNEPAGRTPQVSKVMLLRAYRQLSAKKNEYQSRYLALLDELAKTQPEDNFVQAALGDRSLAENRTEEAISHLKLALPEGDSAIYLELGQALAKLGRSEDAIEFLKKGVESDPYNALMQKTLILQYINSKLYAQAQLLMQQYVVTFPEDTFMRNMLARVSR